MFFRETCCRVPIVRSTIVGVVGIPKCSSEKTCCRVPIVRSTIVGVVGIPKCSSEKRVVVSPLFALL